MLENIAAPGLPDNDAAIRKLGSKPIVMGLFLSWLWRMALSAEGQRSYQQDQASL